MGKNIQSGLVFKFDSEEGPIVENILAPYVTLGQNKLACWTFTNISILPQP
jgi:hypothetical protein